MAGSEEEYLAGQAREMREGADQLEQMASELEARAARYRGDAVKLRAAAAELAPEPKPRKPRAKRKAAPKRKRAHKVGSWTVRAHTKRLRNGTTVDVPERTFTRKAA